MAGEHREIEYGVDLETVESFMDARGLGTGAIHAVQLIGGGTQNVMLAFSRGDRRFVLRRGPEHVRPGTNNGLCREMRILAALGPTPVPHPRLIAACPDVTVLGDSVFYLMEPVVGFNAVTTLPPAYAADPLLRHGLGLAAMDALATLGAVDYAQAGLSDFGRPEGFLERQVPRWLHELESYSTLDGYPGPDIPGVGRVADWLERNRPSSWQAGIMHGDYHFGNVMFKLDRAEVAAIVDWEMSTIGDPLLDVGWMLATWPYPGEREPLAVGAVVDAGGLAHPSELVARYAAKSTRDMSAMPWYAVLACFKLGIVLEGTYARSCAGKAPRAVGEQFRGITRGLFDRAEAFASGAMTV